ncbi:dihydrofolate reductase family protein [Kutzneria chonburiensis]|uniref:Dihydrofolate reductase family protein n=1 Tax=Kutzneria chonburiensis TaxID=1483604 RepID=A0ABV6MQL8_9PSEU|nr:dihydrofolate reductase family protein [Kutzneria chonburiensis]
MARLIYCMNQSLDGHTADVNGAFGWGGPDETVHAFFNELTAPIGTFLYGRRMYETMVFWETAGSLHDEPPVFHEFAELWRAADKIVYSRTLTVPSSARTEIRPEFDVDDVRRLKASATRDIAIAGPTLAAEAVRAGLVDEYQLVISPALTGGGTRFFPEGVATDLELLEVQRITADVVFLRYAKKD